MNATLPVSAPPSGPRHYAVLDGWRAVSIALVLLGHLLPLGPKRLQMNGTIAGVGMVLFFILSGFLIASFLLRQPAVRPFLIRRFCRIVPLAWLYMTIVLVIEHATLGQWSGHLLFYANLPPFWLLDATAHLWSLCLEMQFYVGIALLVAVLGRRALWLLPIVCLVVTGHRIATGATMSIVTSVRLDEILAGSTLALAVERWPALENVRVPGLAYLGLALLLVLSAHPAFEALNYLRPYIAAALVGLTLYGTRGVLKRQLERPQLAYLAKVSYAVYVIHEGLNATWLGSGDKLTSYLKRPLLFAVLFLLAHLSTFHFESRWIALGQRWARRFGPTPRTGDLP